MYYHWNYQNWGHKLNKKYRFEYKKQKIVKYENLFSNIKMGKEILTFGDIEIKKFENFKSLFFSKDVDFEDILVSNKISSGEKKM